MAEKSGVDGRVGGGVKMEEEGEEASEIFQVPSAASFSADPAGVGIEYGSSSSVDSTLTHTHTAQSKSQPSHAEPDSNAFHLPSSRDLSGPSSERTVHRDTATFLGNTATDSDTWHGQDVQSSNLSSMRTGGDSWGATDGVWGHMGNRNAIDLGHQVEGIAEDRLRHTYNGECDRTNSSDGGPWTSTSASSSADANCDTRRYTGYGTGANGPQGDSLGGLEDIWGPSPAPVPAALPAPAFTPAVTSLPVSSGINGLTGREVNFEQWTQPSLSSSKSQPLPQRVLQRPSYTPRSQQQQQQVPRRIPLKTTAVTAVRVSRAGGLPTPPMALPRLPPGMHRSPSNSPTGRSDGTMPPPSSSPATRKRLRAVCPNETNIECGSRSEGTDSIGMCIDSEGIVKGDRWRQGQGSGEGEGREQGQGRGHVQWQGQGQGQDLGSRQWQAQGNGQEEEKRREQGQGRGQGRTDVLFPVPTHRVAGGPPTLDRPLEAAQYRDSLEFLWGGAALDYTPSTAVPPASSGQKTAYVPASVPVPVSAPAASAKLIVGLPHFDAIDEEEW
jgi:hypothetical protein